MGDLTKAILKGILGQTDKPQPEDFDSIEGFIEALMDWKLGQRLTSVDPSFFYGVCLNKKWMIEHISIPIAARTRLSSTGLYPECSKTPLTEKKPVFSPHSGYNPYC